MAEARRETDVVFVDVHAEATSEKVALARWLDGKVTAVIGTHTHVQTNDPRVLPGGTAALSDAGMTGPHDSVIGVQAPRCRCGSRRPPVTFASRALSSRATATDARPPARPFASAFADAPGRSASTSAGIDRQARLRRA